MIHKLLVIFALSVFCFFYAEFALGMDLYVCAPSGVILREKPNRQSEKVATIPFREKVSVLSPKGPSEEIEGVFSAWFQVKFHHQTGWIFAGFLSGKFPILSRIWPNKNQKESLRQRTLEFVKNKGEPLVSFDEMKARWWRNGEPGPAGFRDEFLVECLTNREYKAFYAFRQSARWRTDNDRINQAFDFGGFDFGIIPCDLDADGQTDVVVQLKAGKLFYISAAQKKPLPFQHEGKPFYCGEVLIDWECGVPRILYGAFEPESCNACHLGLRKGIFENVCGKTCGCSEE